MRDIQIFKNGSCLQCNLGTAPFVLKVIAVILGYYRFKCRNCTFDLSVVRLASCQTLDPKSGCGNDSGDDVIVSACKLDDLICDCNDYGKYRNLNEHSKPQNFPRNAEYAEYDDRNEQNDEDEGCAATGMES